KRWREAWSRAVTDRHDQRRRRRAIRLDDDVLVFFRAMGAGYLTRINAVLRTFMLARLAGVVTGPEGVSYAPSLEDEARTLRREILDHAAKVSDAREAEEREAEMREKVKGLAALRDSRLGR
ncbi:MAG: BrnA antitoxin family protein, partial [Bdellovibrionales bacterium]|nr:BrnA antitoxin family protein [Bdellovibrionales bacterium]